MTTEEYNEFATFRGKMLKEPDTETSEDMTTRLYEYGAMKFLDMDHDMYVRAKKDEIRMAVDACLHISSWNGQIGGSGPEEKKYDPDNPSVPLPKPGDEYMQKTKVGQGAESLIKSKQQKVSSYYKSPDEE